MEKQKMFFTSFVVILLAVLGTLVPLALSPKAALAADATPNVVINEVMWTDSNISSSDQWIELKNTTDLPIDISNWTLTNSMAGGASLTIPSGNSIAANGYYLISDYAQGDPNTVLNMVPDFIATSLSLGNNCSQIDLLDSTTTVVDSMGCNGVKYFYPIDVTTFHSLERNQVITNGTLATSWHEATKSTNILSSATDVLATPGAVNSDFVLPVTDLAVKDLPNDNGGAVDLNWTASSDAVTYNLSYQRVDGSGTPTLINNVLTNSYTVTGLDPLASYNFSVTAVDKNGNLSTAETAIGQGLDNLPPEPPVISSVSSTCPTSTCQVTLNWTALDSDTVAYQVAYTVDGVTTRTMKITSTSLVLALPANKAYVLTVYSFDAAGNMSVESNQIIEAPVYNAPVVKTIAKKKSVIAKVTTPATALAASPIPTSNTTAPATSAPTVSDSTGASGNDWLRITVIVVVLLAVAGGFYALSRSFADKDSKPVARQKTLPTKKTEATQVKRGRGRPKGTIKVPPKPKSTRGRGRPRKNP